MKDETAGAATEEFVRLKSKMCSYFTDDNSEHKKARGFKQRCCHNEYKDVLLNKKCLRYSMNRFKEKTIE